MNTIKKTSLLAVLGMFSIIGSTLPMSAFAAGPDTINLGSAGNFVILSKTGISTTGSTSVVGDLGVSPVAASYVTGFALSLPSASPFSTSALVTGKIYASDYTSPTPSMLTTAVSDMETAYTNGAGRSNTTATELGAGNISGLTIAPGLYKWGTGVLATSNVTLSGSANDVWIFQIAQGLDISSGVNIVLAGGAQASNVFWIVAGQTTIGTTAVFNGIILDKTAIVLKTGARLNGRAFAQTAVTLDSNAVIQSSSSSVPTPTPASTPAPVVQTQTTSSNSSSNTSTTQTPVTSNPSMTIDPNIALQAQVDSLTARIRIAQQSQASAQGLASSAFGQSVRTIATNMTVGSKGNNVNSLQAFLISQNKGSRAQALGNVGATSYFGSLTKQALAEFQASVGISPASGYFGPITRAHMEANY